MKSLTLLVALVSLSAFAQEEYTITPTLGGSFTTSGGQSREQVLRQARTRGYCFQGSTRATLSGSAQTRTTFIVKIADPAGGEAYTCRALAVWNENLAPGSTVDQQNWRATARAVTGRLGSYSSRQGGTLPQRMSCQASPSARGAILDMFLTASASNPDNRPNLQVSRFNIGGDLTLRDTAEPLRNVQCPPALEGL